MDGGRLVQRSMRLMPSVDEAFRSTDFELALGAGAEGSAWRDLESHFPIVSTFAECEGIDLEQTDQSEQLD
jgi:hypothetical protein